MLDAIQKRCPALTGLFNQFYGQDAMCFFIVDGEVEIIWSTEGSRMGCTMGSFGFDLTVQDIYEAVDTEFATEDIKLKAATDDLTIGVPTGTTHGAATG